MGQLEDDISSHRNPMALAHLTRWYHSTKRIWLAMDFHEINHLVSHLWNPPSSITVAENGLDPPSFHLQPAAIGRQAQAEQKAAETATKPRLLAFSERGNGTIWYHSLF